MKIDQEEIARLENRLLQLEADRFQLTEQIKVARDKLFSAEKLSNNKPVLLGQTANAVAPKTSIEKVELFLRLFRCRESVFAKRWENMRKKRLRTCVRKRMGKANLSKT